MDRRRGMASRVALEGLGPERPVAPVGCPGPLWILVTVGVGAAVAVAACVPLFQHNLGESPYLKARQDLDTIRQSVALHDSQEPPLRGTSFRPLIGRYLQEDPLDPWGRPYLLDGRVGVALTLGADGVLGGGVFHEDEDQMVWYGPELRIEEARYTGARGMPAPGDAFHIRWSKPYRVRPGSDPLHDLVLVVDSERGSCVRFSGGAMLVESPGTVADSSGSQREAPPPRSTPGWFATRWALDEGASDPDEGLMVVRCTVPELDHREHREEVRISGTMAVDVSLSVLRRHDRDPISLSAIEASPAAGSPFDAGVHGERALDPGRAMPRPRPDGRSRGAPLEGSWRIDPTPKVWVRGLAR